MTDPQLEALIAELREAGKCGDLFGAATIIMRQAADEIERLAALRASAPPEGKKPEGPRTWFCWNDRHAECSCTVTATSPACKCPCHCVPAAPPEGGKGAPPVPEGDTLAGVKRYHRVVSLVPDMIEAADGGWVLLADVRTALRIEAWEASERAAPAVREATDGD